MTIKRWIHISLIFGLVPLAFFPLFLDFHPTAKVTGGHLLAITGVGMLVAYALFSLDLISVVEVSRWEKVKQLLRAFVVIPLLLLGLIIFTLPYAHTKLFGHRGDLRGTIAKRSSGMSKRRSCDYFFYVAIDGVDKDGKICTSKAQWQAAEIGDQVSMEVLVGDYGYIKYSIRLAI